MTTAIAKREPDAAPLAAPGPMTSLQVMEQVKLVQDIMQGVMKEGEHYGTIPGCGDKPTLLKAGAEKLALTFRIAPEFREEIVDLGGGHREVRIKTRLTSILTGAFLGEGLGSASTMEAKHRYRSAERVCPKCGKTTIIKGKEEYGGGWLCFAKKGGCGAKFANDDKTITGQNLGKVENPDPADSWNTVLKMAKKRSLVDAILTATAASDIFTQDIEDLADTIRTERAAHPTEPPPETKPKGRATKPAPEPDPEPGRHMAERDAEQTTTDGPAPFTGNAEKAPHRWQDTTLPDTVARPKGVAAGTKLGDLKEVTLDWYVENKLPELEERLTGIGVALTEGETYFAIGLKLYRKQRDAKGEPK